MLNLGGRRPNERFEDGKRRTQTFWVSSSKKAIPPQCFKRSLIRSFASFSRDLSIIYTLFHIASNYTPLLPKALTYVRTLQGYHTGLFKVLFFLGFGSLDMIVGIMLLACTSGCMMHAAGFFILTLLELGSWKYHMHVLCNTGGPH